MKSSKNQILFMMKSKYKTFRSWSTKFKELNATHYDLISQQRIEAGEEYINFIDDLFDMQNVSKYKFPGTISKYIVISIRWFRILKRRILNYIYVE